MKNIKLCVFDLDGTLLNSNKKITQETLLAVKNLSNYNIKYTIATGRIDILARKYQREICSDLPIISCNGSIIRDLSNKIYYMKTLDFETVKNIFNYFKSLELNFLFYTENSILVTKNNPRIEFLKNYNKTANKNDQFNFEIMDDDINKYSNLKFLKSLAHIENRPKLLEIQSILNKDFKNLSIVSSDYELLDLMPSGINKGTALSILCDILNIESENVCVFGDNFNDIEMINFAGTSIVPENGENDVKKLATHITKTNDEEGISYAINNIILKNV
ncbi:Cof-type HAD-IIB family hydrolase [Candidatus Arthromitus sp. SFB-turkey]|uniref:Cof-type HAD-IIB family hydrolase n=1 Tax=Candidatus Arthromitus sp. SFB-turkey TaxID=1840217 RepID=UPI0007F3BA69|nr:Cof-type HAD-IIB family hydrolase [Candidatus Arthromitus sp. SFB-turkey]OAT88806.1 hydrolase Cof [Candidatus Arthromitus sp. SFB-turkey]HJD00867.1 Cof-type HAD-IIB family hydrolase [Candidatus Dwaynia gallinarum]